MMCEKRDDHIRPGKPGAFAACCLIERQNTRILVPTDVSPLQ